MREAQSLQARGRHRVAKVPEKITVYFWMIKLLTTAMGEALSDFLVHHMNPYLAVVMGAAVFAMAILLQFRSRRYAAPTYWLAVAMVAVFGTMAADATHVALSVSYPYSTVTFAIILGIVFFSGGRPKARSPFTASTRNGVRCSTGRWFSAPWPWARPPET